MTQSVQNANPGLVDQQEVNHINTLRAHMLDQLRALRRAEPGEALDAELERTKGVAAIAQTIINSAKVEIDYLVATKQASAPFLEVPPDQPYITAGGKHQTAGPSNGITSITRHHLKG